LKELIALLVVTLMLVGACIAYAANTYPAHYSTSKGGTIRGRTIPSSRNGSMGGQVDGWQTTKILGSHKIED
jgi:hypothetical protein